MRSPFGFVVIDKPAGVTSHDCVNRLRQVFGIKRVGHGGTLDPAVTGVLPIALGNATRLLPYLPGDKSYNGIIQLGMCTTTDDMEGECIKSLPWPELDKSLIKKYLDQFCGSIQQRPPQFSSIHILGERAYKRARRGLASDLPSRTVIIHELNLLNWNPATGQLNVHIHCSAGTYIRSLARDLGELLGCGGCLAKLRRVQALGFLEAQSITLPEKTNNHLAQPPQILPPLSALNHLPNYYLTADEDLSKWQTGQKIHFSAKNFQVAKESQFCFSQNLKESIVILDCAGEIAGIAQLEENSLLKPRVVFNAKG